MSFLLSYVLNALWQIPLLYAAAVVAARLLRPAGPLAEHRVWLTAATLQTLLPACFAEPGTWLRALRPPSAGTADGNVSIQLGAVHFRAGLHVPPTLARTLLVLYALALLYAIARILRASVLTATLRRTALPVVLSPAADAVWQSCRSHFRLSNANRFDVQLAESESLRTPVTLGLRNPLILFPTGLLATLVPEDLHTILAHESAHIRRHDYASNLVLQVLALPIAFHPFTHITRSRLTETREIVCDTLAAEAITTSPTASDTRSRYARSLLRLASALAQGPSAAAPHAIGIFDAHTLERRIMSLTHATPRLSRLRRAALLTTALTLGSVTCASALSFASTLHPEVTALSSTQPADPIRVGAGVMAGEVHTKVAPKYPQAAKDAHIQGSVLLHAVIGTDGTIEELSVISGPPELQASALEAVRQWTYQPYLLNGEPTEVETTITINYALAP